MAASLLLPPLVPILEEGTVGAGRVDTVELKHAYAPRHRPPTYMTLCARVAHATPFSAGRPPLRGDDDCCSLGVPGDAQVFDNHGSSPRMNSFIWSYIVSSFAL